MITFLGILPMAIWAGMIAYMLTGIIVHKTTVRGTKTGSFEDFSGGFHYIKNKLLKK